MRRLVVSFLTALTVLVLLVAPSLARVTAKSLPTATFSGNEVTLTGGNFSGLGSTPAIAEFQVTAGVATYTCTNPNGNPSPGQNPVSTGPGTTSTQDLGNADHNGRGTISNLTATVSAPATQDASTAGCGGGGAASQGKWTVTLNSVTATAARLVIKQGGNTIFCRDYTLNGPATGTACPN